MVERIFRVISNSEEFLTADVVAEALLKQITLNSIDSKIIFGVVEVTKDNSKSKTIKNLLSLNCE
ncbi:MAG: hypothetical protein KAS99_05170 [Candidatus Omnitrophica bacterium]|nr:hypothetical protein [Candidatus Omnitrophota bacterium]